jgi:hypothetical protein
LPWVLAFTLACSARSTSFGENAERPGTSTGGSGGYSGGSTVADAGDATADGSTGGAAGAAEDGGETGGRFAGENDGGPDTGIASDAPRGGGPGEDAPFTLPSGSYDLVLTDVHIDHNAAAPVPPGGSPAEKLDLHLEYRLADGTPKAWLTPRWGDSDGTFAVNVRPNEIILDIGNAALTVPTASGSLTDTFRKLRITPSDVPGTLAAVEVTLEETVYDHEISWLGLGTAKGNLVADKLPPEVRVEFDPTTGSRDTLLPWESPLVRAAEGVTPLLTSSLEAKIGKPGPGLDPKLAGAPAPLVTRDLEAEAGLDPKFTGLSGMFLDATATSWDKLRGSKLDVKVRSQSVVDLAGNSMRADFFTQWGYLDIGPAVDEYAFGGSAPAFPGNWGSVKLVAKGSDPRCASSGCIQLGPFENGICDVPHIGVAGRLRGHASVLKIRYRILAADDPGGGAPYVFARPFPFSVQIASAFSSGDFAVDLAPLHDLGAAAGELHWGSGDQTAEMDFAADDSPEVGFAIYVGEWGYIRCAGGASHPAGTKTLVIIDRVGF